MPPQSKPKDRPDDRRLTDEEMRLRQTLSANLAEGLALTEFASTLPERERMTDSEILQAFRADQRDDERKD
jgi:hypothetical protein